MANHIRIDRVTQGPDGHETPADRLRVDSNDFLWFYVEAELPSAGPPLGEYFSMRNGKPDPATRFVLSPPTVVRRQYRFLVAHGLLSSKKSYLFHFVDNFAAPKFHDQWEVETV